MKIDLLRWIVPAIFGATITGVANAAILNTTADPLPACDASATTAIVPAGAAQCGVTPTVYKIRVHEMGVCTSHPYGTGKDEATFDASTCSVVYADTAATPEQVDIAASLGTAAAMNGTSTLPPVGTYAYPYLVFKDEFTTSARFASSGGTITRSDTSGASENTDTAAGVEITESLNNFDDDLGGVTVCTSGYTGAAVTGGTIDGFITDAAHARSLRAENSSVGGNDVCDKRGRLVGVMTLSAPFTITPQTFGLNFSFNLTNQGVQFIDNCGGATDRTPECYASAPFSGKFEVLNQD
jgi:hypothetical protein